VTSGREIAMALGYLIVDDLAESLELADRVRAMDYRLSR
jgi:hypothetical protein